MTRRTNFFQRLIRCWDILGCVLGLALSSCTTPTERASRMAQDHALTPAVLTTTHFNLMTYASMPLRPGLPLAVYIEGDGHAWLDRSRLSDDPTPRHAMALEFASLDPSPNRVYIARPCQFVVGADGRNCQSNDWSVARFSQDAVVSISEAIDDYMRLSGALGVKLYGYSGGGTIALLLAARRTDVLSVVTVAGIPDTASWTTIRGTTRLWASLNPADFSGTMDAAKQTLIIGAEDEVVPPEVTQSYLSRFPASARPHVINVPGQTHGCCWANVWPDLLRRLGHAP